MLCVASLFVPLPFVRILAAAFCAFCLMIAVKMIRDR
jgi:hypothetical protein